MRLVLILSTLTIAYSDVVEENDCDGIFIDGVYNDREILRENIEKPYLLTADYTTHMLYFSYSVDDGSKTARIDLESKELSDIGVDNGFAQTIDRKTHEVYIGADGGLYKYNQVTNKAKLIGENGTSIWNVFFKDVLYFSSFPEQFLYIFNDNNKVRLEDLEDTKVDLFIIDEDDVEFFTNATGLFSQKKGTKDAIYYKYEEEPIIRGLTTDTLNNVYACLPDGIYVVNKNTTSLDKVVNVEEAFGIAFDYENNMIYSDKNNLFRLKPNAEKNCQQSSEDFNTTL